MQDGRIVETGSHNELLAKRGLYYHLYKAQFEHVLSVDNPFIENAEREAEANKSQGRLALAIK